MDEAVDDHGRPADEKGDGDGGHEQVHAPAPLLHRLVRARRPGGKTKLENIRSSDMAEYLANWAYFQVNIGHFWPNIGKLGR